MIRVFEAGLEPAVSRFLDQSPSANYCHDPAWSDVIREAYGKEAFVFVRTDPVTEEIRGLAPACYLASTGFGKNLVCLPYLDYGGILAEDPETEDLLRDKLLAEALSRRAKLEIRSLQPLCDMPRPRDIKVAMILPLSAGESHQPSDWTAVPGNGGLFEADAIDVAAIDDTRTRSAEGYWKNLDPKVRNQVRKAEKSGVKVKWGREELLDDFYAVFCVNMHDLGSPTHAKKFFASVLAHFPGAQIGAAMREGKCIGGLFRILWKDVLVIPWASTLKDERVHCPNNALYWESIRFAFERGCTMVDFGRSSKDQGTYRFKKQWLAQELPLYSYQFDEKGHLLEHAWHIAQGKLAWTRNIWAKLPLKLANSLGPMLRGSISA